MVSPKDQFPLKNCYNRNRFINTTIKVIELYVNMDNVGS